jgi:serine phosphatase RsbU (regulator of sigma subunit)
VNCGHLPRLIVDEDGARFVGQGGLMLGLPMHDPHAELTVLRPGATMLMITDGLVEERRVFLDDNLEKLRATAEDAARDGIEAFVNRLMALFGPRDDDVAMIAVRRIGPAGAT